jgi:cytochrome c oxidase cbb3-type subunit 3
MMKNRVGSVVLASLALALALSGCYREKRPTTAPPGTSGVAQPTSTAQPAPIVVSHYTDNAYAVSQGKTWYRAFNCNGCHAAGGGNMGPPLMDARWRYGADPASIYASIAYGRPNGMPAFGSHLTEDQIWQLAAFVRSLSGQLSKNVASSRGDTLQDGKGESRREKETPVPEQTPGVER